MAALKNCLVMVGSRWQHFWNDTDFVFVVLMILMSFMFMKVSNGKNRIKQLCIAILILLLPIVTAFSIALGYSSYFLPNRAAFLIDISIVASFSCFVGICGILLNGVLAERKRVFMYIVTMFAVLVLAFDGYGLYDVNIGIMYKNDIARYISGSL